MLHELNQNITMDELKKDKLLIHHANVFHPKPLGITSMTDRNGDLVAVSKDYSHMGDFKQPLSILEIYKIGPKFAPRLIQTLFNYETVTGIAWASPKLLLTVTKEQTINFWSLRKGTKCMSIVTDYGPITCMKYSAKYGLLVTGTVYGYAAAYKICANVNSIEFQGKMVKIPSAIQSIDLGFGPELNVTPKLVKPASNEPKVKSRKRKRKHDSDDSDDEQVKIEDAKFPNIDEVNVYGATQSEVVVWDYHKKTIVETIRGGDKSCHVLTLRVLRNRDILVGDSDGYLSLFSNSTFTCRQNLKVLESSLLCIAVNDPEDIILVSGKEPTVVILKRQEAIGDEFLLFERIETHIHDVRSMVFTSNTEFFSGAIDGFFVRYKIKDDKKTRRLIKNVTLPNYHHDIKLSKKEMMIQYDRSLVIWKLPRSSSDEIDTSQDGDQLNPVKSLLLQARTHVHSSTFSDRWICYSNEKDVYIFDRLEGKLTSRRPDKKLPNCNLLVLCANNRYLAACAGHELYIIDLDDGNSEKTSPEESRSSKFKVAAEYKLKSTIRHAMGIESENMLVVGCGPPKSMIYTYSFNPNSKNVLESVAKLSIQYHEISFVTHNSAVERNPSIYFYSGKDQIIKLDASERNEADVFKRFNKHDSVEGLPDDANILGMVFVSADHCILYDNHRMFKVDLASNKVVNQSTDYDYIIKMDNFVFDKADQIALVELTPDEYRRAIPNVKQWKKFGQ